MSTHLFQNDLIAQLHKFIRKRMRKAVVVAVPVKINNKKAGNKL